MQKDFPAFIGSRQTRSLIYECAKSKVRQRIVKSPMQKNGGELQLITSSSQNYGDIQKMAESMFIIQGISPLASKVCPRENCRKQLKMWMLRKTLTCECGSWICGASFFCGLPSHFPASCREVAKWEALTIDKASQGALQTSTINQKPWKLQPFNSQISSLKQFLNDYHYRNTCRHDPKLQKQIAQVNTQKHAEKLKQTRTFVQGYQTRKAKLRAKTSQLLLQQQEILRNQFQIQNFYLNFMSDIPIKLQNVYNFCKWAKVYNLFQQNQEDQNYQQKFDKELIDFIGTKCTQIEDFFNFYLPNLFQQTSILKQTEEKANCFQSNASIEIKIATMKKSLVDLMKRVQTIRETQND